MPEILSRAQWGATAPLGPPMRLPAVECWLHHSVTAVTGDPAADMRSLERIGVQRFGRFSYSWAVHPSGILMEGAGFTIGAHTKGRNSTSFGVVWVGNYEVDQPTRAQVDVTADLIRWLVDAGRLRPGVYPTGGHRDAPGASTACPGANAYQTLDRLRALVAAGPTQEDEMPLTNDDLANIANAVWARDVGSFATAADSAADVVRHVRAGVAQLLARAPGDVDEAELARQILAVLSPEAIAAALPDELAAQVADVLADRLAG